MHTPPPVRRATLEDATELARLRTVMFDSLGDRDTDTGWHAHAVEALRTRLAEPEGRFAAFVVDRPGAGPATDPGTAPKAPSTLAACAVGTVELRLPGPNAPRGLVGHVFNVATDPDFRRRGYSRACMTALLAWYRQHGVRKIDLFATPEGEPLYASLGFARGSAPAMRLEY